MCIILVKYINRHIEIKQMEFSRINQGDGFLRIFTVAFLLFPAPAGGSNPTGQLLTLN